MERIPRKIKKQLLNAGIKRNGGKYVYSISSYDKDENVVMMFNRTGKFDPSIIYEEWLVNHRKPIDLTNVIQGPILKCEAFQIWSSMHKDNPWLYEN